MWNPYERGPKYWFYQVYSVYVVNVIIVLRLMNVFMRGINAKNFNEFLEEFSLLTVGTADMIMSITFLLHRVEVLDLADAFNWERNLLGTDEITQHRDRVLTSSISSCKVFTLAIMITSVQYCTFSFYNIFNEVDYHKEMLPIGIAPMKYCFVLPNFWIAFMSDYLSLVLLSLVGVSHDSFIMAVMINIKSQLKILNFRLERCHMTCYNPHDVVRFDDSSVTHFECVERPIINKSMSLDPNEELINCIKLHQEIVRILRIFTKIYSKAFLPQLFISLLLITVLLLQMILGKEGNQTDALSALGFFIPVILQLLAFCWGGNIFIVESDKSSNSLYETHWYDRDREFRNNLRIFLGAVRKPLTVSAGGFCDLSAITFKNILTKAYSGVAVLNNANA